jgi:hypothetical protein
MKQGTAEMAGRSGTALFVRRPILALGPQRADRDRRPRRPSGRRGARAAERRPPVVISVTTDFPAPRPRPSTRRSPSRIEGAVGRVAGVQSISSNSRFGRSRVTLEFSEAPISTWPRPTCATPWRASQTLCPTAPRSRASSRPTATPARDADRRHLGHAVAAGPDAPRRRGVARTGSSPSRAWRTCRSTATARPSSASTSTLWNWRAGG